MPIVGKKYKVHTTKTGRKYIMIRRSGGGTRRMYDGTTYRENGKIRTLRL
jgi:hypothetical protein